MHQTKRQNDRERHREAQREAERHTETKTEREAERDLRHAALHRSQLLSVPAYVMSDEPATANEPFDQMLVVE